MTKQTVKTVTNKAPAIVALPEFDSSAKTIIKAHETLDNASAKTRDVVNFTMQSYIDKCASAGLSKTEADVNRLGKMIRESQTVLDIVALGAMEKKTFTEYAQSAMRAFFHGVPFSASLKNDKTMGLPWGGAKGESKAAPKAGKVTKTTLDEAHKTMAKALAQYRTMLQRDFVADLLDVIQTRFPDFDETAQ